MKPSVLSIKYEKIEKALEIINNERDLSCYKPLTFSSLEPYYNELSKRFKVSNVTVELLVEEVYKRYSFTKI